MKDYNFFEGYKIKRVKKTKSNQLVTVLFLISLICYASIICYNYLAMASMEVRMKVLDDEILVLKTSEDLMRVREKEERMIQLREVVINVEAAGDNINTNSLISENLLAVLADTMPSDVNLISMTIVGNDIHLAGTSLMKPAIAEYEYRLRQIDFVEDIFLVGIETDDVDAYTFTMNLVIGGDPK